MSLSSQPLTRKDVERFHDHFRRHRVESGRGDHHFMPFTPRDPRSGPDEAGDVQVPYTGISVLPAPDGHLYTREPPSPRDCVRRTIVQVRMPSPQPALTCRGLEVRASRGFLRHRSSFVSSLCQAGVLALAARQPAGTGSAQIRWSIAPNRGVGALIQRGGRAVAGMLTIATAGGS